MTMKVEARRHRQLEDLLARRIQKYYRKRAMIRRVRILAHQSAAASP